jgi:hypothetical protein
MTNNAALSQCSTLSPIRLAADRNWELRDSICTEEVFAGIAMVGWVRLFSRRVQKSYALKIATFFFLFSSSNPTAAADDRADKAIHVIQTLCLAKGQAKIEKISSSSIQVEGGGSRFLIEKQEAEGLVGGISSAITKLSAEQADHARECMKPYISQILQLVVLSENHIRTY